MYMYIYICLLRMTDTVTSQNIDFSPWNILYIVWSKHSVLVLEQIGAYNIFLSIKLYFYLPSCSLLNSAAVELDFTFLRPPCMPTLRQQR
jgi:hypothetical protein